MRCERVLYDKRGKNVSLICYGVGDLYPRAEIDADSTIVEIEDTVKSRYNDKLRMDELYGDKMLDVVVSSDKVRVRA